MLTQIYVEKKYFIINSEHYKDDELIIISQFGDFHGEAAADLADQLTARVSFTYCHNKLQRMQLIGISLLRSTKIASKVG